MTETQINKETIKSKEEYLPIPPVDIDPAYVTVTAGATKNLGAYESAKISISIHYPCDPKLVDNVYLKLKDWVDRRVSIEVAEIQEYIDSKKVTI